MKEKLKILVEAATNEAKTITNEADYLNIKAKYLGKKSELAEYMAELKDMSAQDKKTYGPVFNQIKKDLESLFTKSYEAVSVKEGVTFDPTLPVQDHLGSLHPVTIVSREVTDILREQGFKVLTGPEMETEYYNFDGLNFPKTHPAREQYDTYWLDNGDLLRCHTSPAQVRAMQKYGAPLKICVPGRCFRNEDVDASHDNTFFQLEGMVIDKEVSISNFIYVIEGILESVFKQNVSVRLRPGFFPFTEPSFELDCSCLICYGEGCPTCKGSGWIELCPGGMIHPNVLAESGINPDEYTGFAFGLGLTRLAMMKYKINDIRILNSGDLRYLENYAVR